MMGTGKSINKFHSEQIPRRGEVIAWGCASLLIIAWVILRLRDLPVHPAISILTIFLILSGLAISLGNWMDRRTMIRLYDDRVEFHNGLRHVQLKWDEVERVRVFPVRWGKKVQVFGKSSFFEYRTLGEVRVQGELKGRLGFDQGEEILRQIIVNAGLQIAENQAEEYYYVRK